MKDNSKAKFERQQRLSATLRENLKRRKAQAKGRSAAGRAAAEAGEPHDSAGIPEEKEAGKPR